MSKVSTTSFILKHLDVRTRSGFEWLCICPYHDDKSPSFSFHIKKKLFICYACGAKGNLNQLKEHLGASETIQQEEVSLSELSEKIASTMHALKTEKRPKVGVPYPARYKSDMNSIDGYWTHERGLDSNIIGMYNLGFDTLEDHAIIPIDDYRSGVVAGLMRRRCGELEEGTPRYLYPKGMKVSENVFGAYQAMQAQRKFLKNLDTPRTLVITEGAIDAMSVYNIEGKVLLFNRFGMGKTTSGYIGVAVLGARMSREQAKIIAGLDYEKIIIATDMDRAGAMAQVQIATALKDAKCGSIVTKAKWDASHGKDLASLTPEMRQFVLHNAS